MIYGSLYDKFNVYAPKFRPAFKAIKVRKFISYFFVYFNFEILLFRVVLSQALKFKHVL